MSMFFKDDYGRDSMNRLLSFIVVIAGVLLLYVCAYIKWEPGIWAGITCISLGLTGKTLQKAIETKTPPSVKED